MGVFIGLRIQKCLFTTMGFGVVNGAPGDIMRTRYDVNKKNLRNISTDAFYDREVAHFCRHVFRMTGLQIVGMPTLLRTMTFLVYLGHEIIHRDAILFLLKSVLA